MMVLPLIVLFPLGCPAPAGENNGTPGAPDTSGGDVAQKDDLFVAQGDGSYVFTTNDTAYWGPYGYTLWAVMPALSQPTFTQRDVVLTKSSGNAAAGYGIVFCQYDSGNPAHDETMLIVMINTQQQYSVGEATGSVYSPYTNPTWVQDLHLVKGGGNPNEVLVTRDAGGLFSLALNGTQVMTFRDGRTPVQSGGGGGYLAVISPQDSFPAIPVSISYKDK